MEEVTDQVERIRSDRSQGATALAFSALAALRLATASGASHRELMGLAGEIQTIRPSMAPIRNIAFLFTQGLNVGISPYVLCDQLSERLHQSRAQATIKACDVIPNGATLLTCSHSSYVLGALAKAHAAGRSVRVLVLESGVGAGAHGVRLRDDLTDQGVQAELVSDASLSEAAQKASIGLIGVDRVHPDGSLVNGAPSLQMAHALSGRAPLYAVGDGLRLGTPGVLEEGFDVVPPSLVRGLLLEDGLLRPQDVGALPQWAELGLA